MLVPVIVCPTTKTPDMIPVTLIWFPDTLPTNCEVI